MRFHVDGFLLSETNPSPKGGGWTVVAESGIIRKRREQKILMSNNRAEICAILEALTMADDYDSIYSDSDVAIGWIRGKLPKKAIDLDEIKEFVNQARKLYKDKHITIHWVNRDNNIAGWENEFTHQELEQLRPNYRKNFCEIEELLDYDKKMLKMNRMLDEREAKLNDGITLESKERFNKRLSVARRIDKPVKTVFRRRYW